MSLKTPANGFSEPCDLGQQEMCVRICWSNDCVADWDLWVRQRDEPGDTPPSDKWVSYLNQGPVGESNLELSSDMDKSSPDAGSVCEDPTNSCGLVGGGNGFAGELVCWCCDASMTFPKTYDVVVNLFGADEFACPDPLGDVCVEYFQNQALYSLNTISGVFDFQGLGTSGNFGAGNYPQLSIDFFDCTPTTTTTSICWLLTALRVDGRLFVDRGPGRPPSKFIIPDDADVRTCVLIEDGLTIPRHRYEVINESIARKHGLPVASVLEARGMRGHPSCRKPGTRARPCVKCRRGKKKNLF